MSVTVVTTTSLCTNTNPQWGGFTLDASGYFGDSFCPNGQIWASSAGIAGCCVSSSGRCDLTLGCIGQSTIFGVDYTTTCRSGLQCDTDLVYPQYPTGGLAPWSAIYCGGINARTSYYRKLYETITTTLSVLNPTTPYSSASIVASSASPLSSSSAITVAATSSSSSSSSLAITSTSSSSIQSQGASSAQIQPVNSTQSQGASSVRSQLAVNAQSPSISGSQVLPDTASSSASVSGSDNGGNNSSQAWIAGAVVGSVVGVALIAGLAYYLLTRRLRSGSGFAERSGVGGNGRASFMSPSMSPITHESAERTTLPL